MTKSSLSSVLEGNLVLFSYEIYLISKLNEYVMPFLEGLAESKAKELMKKADELDKESKDIFREVIRSINQGKMWKAKTNEKVENMISEHQTQQHINRNDDVC